MMNSIVRFSIQTAALFFACVVAGSAFAKAGAVGALRPAATVSAAAIKPNSARVALVIGNGAYGKAPLKNPVADATAVADELRKLGFDVALLKDAPWQQMNKEVLAFAERAAASDVRVVYYAGHGAQIRGRNYLVPVDVQVDGEDDLQRKSVDLSELTDRLSRQTKAVNVVIVDACRNNPASNVALDADGRRLKMRGAQTPGLAPMRAPAGTLIAYSTAPGQVADDRAGGKNSLYTKHLLNHLPAPGITLEQLFKRVRIGVLEESQMKQQPWDESNLTVDFCFKTGQGGRCPGL
jgi:uncharacterized caspase-like protein